MSDILLFAGLMASVLVLVYGNYATFAWTAIKYSKPMKKVRTEKGVKMVFPKLTVGETLASCIPFWQPVIVRKALYGAAPVWSVLSILSIILIGQNLVFSWFIPINGYVLFFAHIGFFIGAIIAFIVYGYITFDVATMYDCNWLTRILCFLFPYLFCYFVKNRIPHYMADLAKKEVFKAGGDTRIRQKSH